MVKTMVYVDLRSFTIILILKLKQTFVDNMTVWIPFK